MSSASILCFSGSTRGGSYNTRLAALAKKRLVLANATVTQISLADYPLPLYHADEESDSGQPENARRLRDLFLAHHGIFIASPEYNGTISPLLKNTVDWISRLDRGAAYKNRVFAFAAASPGAYGGMRGLITLRQSLEIALGAHVLAEQVVVPHADEAFDEAGELTNARAAAMLQRTLDRLVEMANYYAGRD